ncbi:MAG: IclR family transcriptional regulator, acetate operon repressor [Hyphomicrobiales bacterium]|nr:IclR family transcriptional regulator, acetate operon repressor [Hyphomicrobiales bacterium]
MDDKTVRKARATKVDPGRTLRASQPDSAGRHSIQSVDRAIRLLEAIAEAGGETTLTELSQRTQLNISTCHHLLSTLVHRGYVAKVPVRRSYALGGRILYLSNACLQVDLPARAAPFIEQINEKTGETVHLAVLQGDAMMKVAKRESRHPVRVDTGTLGKSDAAHATASGKAMLAWLPEGEMKRVLAHGMTRYTANTITEWPALIEELRHVRRNGYSMDREEYQPGVICVGAAIRDPNGAVVGAISASTPTMRASDEHLALVREQVTGAVRALSAELGAQAFPNRAPVAAE